MRTEKCSTCEYFEMGPNKQQGECHRNAPRPEVVSQVHFNWPIVDASAWCGEYEEKE